MQSSRPVDLSKQTPTASARRHAPKRRGIQPVAVHVQQSVKPEQPLTVTVEHKPAEQTDRFQVDLEQRRQAATKAWQTANQTRIMPDAARFVGQVRKAFEHPTLKRKRREEQTTAQEFAGLILVHVVSDVWNYCGRTAHYIRLSKYDTPVLSDLERAERQALDHVSDVELLDDHAIEAGRRIAREALNWAYGQLQADLPLPPELRLVG